MVMMRSGRALVIVIVGVAARFFSLMQVRGIALRLAGLVVIQA
jgi:hypothetical protein